MKTANEKAKAILMEYKHNNTTGADLQVLIARAITEQDRDTRQACAEVANKFLVGQSSMSGFYGYTRNISEEILTGV